MLVLEIKTVLFDLDGTLINTNELIIASYLHTLEKYYPNQYKREQIVSLMGLPLDDTFVKMGVDVERIDEYIKTYREHNLANHEKYVHAFEGVLETIEVLSKNKIKIAIVSTKNSQAIRLGLKITELLPYFPTIIGIDDIEKPKPDPEPILKALEILDAKPEHTMMVGDSRYDIEAGKNAGVKTAGVAWTIRGREYLASFEPDYILDNMTDLLQILGVKGS
jgi:pyrophosphatase PpaX